LGNGFNDVGSTAANAVVKEWQAKDKPALTKIGFQGLGSGNEQQLTEITKWLGI